MYPLFLSGLATFYVIIWKGIELTNITFKLRRLRLGNGMGNPSGELKSTETALNRPALKVESRGGLPAPERLYRGLFYLKLLAPISTSLGLWGTITGLFKVFRVIVQMGGVPSAAFFSAGVSEALITTITGLSIAIPCILFYYIYQDCAERIESTLIESRATTNN